MARSKIRTIAALAKNATATPADGPDFSLLLTRALHPQERDLFDVILSNLEEKAKFPSDLHRLDAALAVCTGLVMCRLMDSGQYQELEQLAPAWNRHGKPLIAALNDRVFKGKTVKADNFTSLVQRLLEKKRAAGTMAPPPDEKCAIPAPLEVDYEKTFV